MLNRTVIIVAGGRGLRMKTDIPKQFLLLNGTPLIIHTIKNFWSWSRQLNFIVALPPDHFDTFRQMAKQYLPDLTYFLSEGGETRFHTVKNALNLVSEKSLVAIHDAVRPFVSHAVIDTCFKTCLEQGNAIPVIEILDSVRHIHESGSLPVNRNDYKIVQTPQVFWSSVLQEAYRQDYIPAFTDDASVVESMGVNIHLVDGNRENIKITTSEDLFLAGYILERQ